MIRIRWSFLFVVFVALSAGCIDSASTECAGVTVCPQGKLCAPAGGCAPAGAVTSCAGKDDSADCNYPDVSDGVCSAGICLPVGCGNGVIEVAAGESCDDGNLLPGDGCSGACVAEVCGNGVIDLKAVGLGFLPSEGCDDGENGLNHDGCAEVCQAEAPLWTVTSPTSPSPRFDPAMAYDAARGKVLLFGGVEVSGTNEETWEFDGNAEAWTQVAQASPTTPSPRGAHAIAYDAARGKVLLFGGGDAGGFNGETWEFDGGTQTWTQVAQASPTAPAPSPREDHAMVYDAARGKVLLFGGRDAGGFNGETWEFDGKTEAWTQVAQTSPTAPSPRSAHAMAYDAVRGKVLLFGGKLGGMGGPLDSETWEFDGITKEWSHVAQSSPTAPSSRHFHAMAYDAARRKVLLFGGDEIVGTGGNNGETWEFDGNTEAWTQVAAATAPSQREDHAMVYDAVRGKVLLFGGYDDPSGDDEYSNETWEFDGNTEAWTQVPQASPIAPSPREAHAMAYDADRGKVLLYGGYDGGGVSDGETWEFDGNTEEWTQVAQASPTAPSPRQFHAMAYDAARGKVLLFGGLDASGFNDETWEFDGNTEVWTQVAQASPTAPSPREDHAMAYDAVRDKVLLFGGLEAGGNDGETWEFDGNTEEWTQVAQASPTAPSPRYDHGMAYDAVRDKMVLFGGKVGGPLDGETWEFDGGTQTWTQVAQASPTAPSPLRLHAMAYDAARGKVLLFGGFDGGNNGETWEYDGGAETWTELAAPTAPSPRYDHAMTYDAVRGQVVVFGGLDNGADSFNGETWAFQYRFASVRESCTTGFDGDGDGLIGCADPDCWGRCTPSCPPFTTPEWPADCDTASNACGDGVCNANLESCRLCPSDCGACTPECGDFICEGGETQANCPGDCTP